MSHRIGNRIITKVFNILMGTKLSDVLTGMHMLKTETARNLNFRRIEVDKRFIERGKRQGYGEFKVPILQAIISGLKGEPRITLKDSFFAASAGDTGKVECWIIAGMIAGAARKILDNALKNYARQRGTTTVNSGSKAELQSTIEKPSVALDSTTSGSSSKLLDCPVTHKWEVKRCQDSHVMGIVIGFRSQYRAWNPKGMNATSSSTEQKEAPNQ